MTERKTIGDAMDLPDVKVAFIKTGKVEPPKPARTVPKTIELPAKADPSESDPETSEVDLAEDTKPSRRGRTRREPKAPTLTEQAVIDNILEHKSFRIRHKTLVALNDAWLDRRRLDKTAKQQAIAQEALDNWLRTQGYLD